MPEPSPGCPVAVCVCWGECTAPWPLEGAHSGVTGIQTGNLAVVGDILCIVGMRVCVWESVCVTLEAKVSPLFVLSVKTRSLSALRPAKDVRVAE